MAKKIAKNLSVTRVSFCTVVVNDGEPAFVYHPDAVFNGLLEQPKVEKLLKARLGKDALIVITKIDAGQHRFEMDLETFVLNAVIADGANSDDDDGDEDDAIDAEAGSEDDSDPASAEPPATEPAAAPAPAAAAPEASVVPSVPAVPAQPEASESTDLPLG